MLNLGTKTHAPLTIGTDTLQVLSLVGQELSFSNVINEAGNDVDIRIEGSTDENLIYTDAGNNYVGIGTATPSSKLHIYDTTGSAFEIVGDSNVANFKATSYRNSEVSHAFFHFQGARGTQASPLDVQADDGISRMFTGAFFDGSFKSMTDINSLVDGTPSATSMPGRIVFATSPTGTVVVSEKMRISSNSVTVNEDGSDYDFRIEGDNDVNLLFVDASTDRVGIGTDTPLNILHIVDSNSAGTLLRMQNTAADGYGGIDIYNSSTVLTTSIAHSNASATVLPNSTWLGTRNAESLHFVTNGVVPRMTIDSTGRVGIGTETPSGLLRVNGTETATNGVPILNITNTTDGMSIRMGVSATSNYSWIEAVESAVSFDRPLILNGFDGDVGIGNTAPISILHVGQDTTAVSNFVTISRNGTVSSGVQWSRAGSTIDAQVYMDANELLRISNDFGSHIILEGGGNVGVGLIAPSGKLHIDQSSTTAVIPVLKLDQADLSEEFIQFDTTVGAGNPIDTAAIGTYYGKARVSVNGSFRYVALYNS